MTPLERDFITRHLLTLRRRTAITFDIASSCAHASRIMFSWGQMGQRRVIAAAALCMNMPLAAPRYGRALRHAAATALRPPRRCQPINMKIVRDCSTIPPTAMAPPPDIVLNSHHASAGNSVTFADSKRISLRRMLLSEHARFIDRFRQCNCASAYVAHFIDAHLTAFCVLRSDACSFAPKESFSTRNGSLNAYTLSD